ncbi:MAG: hypothetical protein ACK5ML_05980 [Lachnospiraceae bacterium]
MKKSRTIFFITLSLTVLLLTGCGTEMYVLSPEKEQAVISYAAYATVKQFKYAEPVTETGTSSEQEVQDPDTNTELDVTTEQIDVTELDDTELTSDTELPADTQAPVSLTDALGLKDRNIDVSFGGAERMKSYSDQNYFSMDADSGTQFLVLHITITNSSEQVEKIDLLSQNPVFRVVTEDGSSRTAMKTILVNDLSTYQGELQPGISEETVLLFQIPDTIEQTDRLALQVTINGATKTVDL